MPSFITYNPESDELYNRTHGYVRAERINDMLAKPDSKRYREYLRLVQDQFAGEPILDDKDQYREKAKELLPRALEAYQGKNGVEYLGIQRLYFHPDSDLKICCAPDAVEGDVMGITVHIRQTLLTYQDAKEAGITDTMEKHAQAMMLVTRLPYWLHINYYENEETRTRKLSEHDTEFDKLHAAALEEAMMSFLLRTRRRAAG